MGLRLDPSFRSMLNVHHKAGQTHHGMGAQLPHGSGTKGYSEWVTSDWPISRGHQGFILGLVLFNIFINDLDGGDIKQVHR